MRTLNRALCSIQGAVGVSNVSDGVVPHWSSTPSETEGTYVAAASVLGLDHMELSASSELIAKVVERLGVLPRVARSLRFLGSPSTVVVGGLLSPPVTVEALDQYGARYTGAPVTVSLSLAENASGATLAGASGVSTIDGIATFPNVAINAAAVGLVLRATVPGVTTATSASFSSVAPGPAIIALSTASLSFDGVVSEAPPAGQPIQITNAGGGALSFLTASIAYGIGEPTGWLSLSLNSSTAPASLSVQATQGTIASGTYSATILVTSADVSVANSPQAVSVTFAVRRVPSVVTTSAGTAGSMVIAGLSLYGFGNSQCFNVCVAAGINRVDLETGTVRSLVPFAQNTFGIINPVRLLADGSYVYWMDGNVNGTGARIRRVSVDGGAVDSLAGGFGVPGTGAFAQDATHLYFASSAANDPWSIKRVPKVGGSVEGIVAASPNTGFAVDDGYLYYQLRLVGQVRRIPVGGGSSTVVASELFLPENHASHLYVADGTLYYSDLESIRTVPKAGGAVTRRASEPGVINMISDGTALYVRGFAAEIVRFLLHDFSRSVVATLAVEGPALDDNYIYWSTLDSIYFGSIIGSRVLRIPK